MKLKKYIFIGVVVLSMILGFIISMLYEQVTSIKNEDIVDTSQMGKKDEIITVLKSTFKYDDNITFNISVTNENNYIVIVPSYIPLDNISFMKDESINTWKNATSGKYETYIDDRFSNGEYEIRLIENNEVLGAKKIIIDSDLKHESPTYLKATTNYVANDTSKLLGLSIKFKHSSNIYTRYLKLKIRVDHDQWIKYKCVNPFTLDEEGYGTIALFDFSGYTLDEFANEYKNLYGIIKNTIAVTYNSYYVDLENHTIEIALSYDGEKYSVPIYLNSKR